MSYKSIAYLAFGLATTAAFMVTFAAAAYVLDGNRCFESWFSWHHCSFTERVSMWLFSKIAIFFLVICQIPTINSFMPTYTLCKRCKKYFCTVLVNHRYRTKNYHYAHCCDQCDVKRGKSKSFINNKYYFKNGLCSFCKTDNFTRAYRVYYCFKMCANCWLQFNQ